MPKYLDGSGLEHFWETVQDYVKDAVRNISNVDHIEIATSNTEPNEQPASGSLLLNQDVLEIDTRTNGNRSGHNTGFCTNVNDYGNRELNIGLGQHQAAADFVANSVLIKDVPYTHLFQNESISSVSGSGIEFAQDVSDYVLVGNVLWLTESMERSPSTYQTGFRKYSDVFVYQTYAGIVTNVDGASVTVGAWYELPWTGNTSPSATSTPALGGDMKCYVNPLNGIYGHYDLLKVPAGVPNGYKLYHSQTHIYNDCDEAVYSNGDLIVFESGSNGYGYAASQSSSNGRLEAAFHGKGYINYLLKGDFSDQLPEYRRAITTVGLTSGGTLQKDCQQVDSADDQSQLKGFLTSKNVDKYSAGILRITTSQTIDVNDLLPNAEYEFIMVGQPTLTINNDSSSKILPVSTNTNDGRYDVPAGGSLSIARTTSRSAHNLIRVIYVVPPRLSSTASYPNVTQRDLIITIEALTLADYTITAASAS